MFSPFWYIGNPGKNVNEIVEFIFNQFSETKFIICDNSRNKCFTKLLCLERKIEKILKKSILIKSISLDFHIRKYS
jgi:hypothetical protein